MHNCAILLSMYHNAWNCKYQPELIRDRLVCCFAARVLEKEYWINELITELFCDLADLFRSAE